MIEAKANLADAHDRLAGEDRVNFELGMLGLTSGQRSDRPRQLLEAILAVADGYAVATVPQVELARRIGCEKARAIDNAIVILLRLGVIYRIRDPRAQGTRWHTILAKHPAAGHVVAELASCHQVVESNPYFRHWIELAPGDGPRAIIPYAEGLGPLLHRRDRQHRAIADARVARMSSKQSTHSAGLPGRPAS